MVKVRSEKNRRANPDRRKGGGAEHTDSEKRKNEQRRLDIERRKKDD